MPNTSGSAWSWVRAPRRPASTSSASAPRTRADRHIQPCVQALDLPDRIGLHRPKVDVVEAIVGTGTAENQRPVHPKRPVFDVERTDVGAIHVVGERADDVGVKIGDGKEDIGRIPVCHHVVGVGKDGIERLEPQHVRRAFQSPRPGRLAPGSSFITRRW